MQAQSPLFFVWACQTPTHRGTVFESQPVNSCLCRWNSKGFGLCVQRVLIGMAVLWQRCLPEQSTQRAKECDRLAKHPLTKCSGVIVKRSLLLTVELQHVLDE